MKTINRNSKIVISLLMVLVMLFSTVAVTAFANTEDGNDTQEVIATAPTVSDTDWYTFTYIPPMEGANAKLDVQIKADASEYWNIGQEDILVLVTDVLTIAVQYAMDTKLGSYVDLEDLGFELLDASYDFSSLPAGVKDMLKDYAKEVLGVDSLADLEKNLTVDEENGITEQYVKDYKEEIQANIDGFIKEVESTGGGVAAVIGAALQASGATEEEISKVVETVKEVVVDPTTATESTVFTEVMEKIYGEKDAETGEIVIPEDKMNVVSNLTTTITNTVEDAANSTFSPIDILKMFKSVSIDEADIISRENGISFDYNAVISALKKIPTPGELANYSVDEYKELLAYSFGIDFFVIGGFDIDLSFGITGTEYQISKIQSVMKIIADHVDIDFARFAEGGKVTFELRVPDEFAAILLKAAKSNMIPDSIKHKLFTCLDKNGNDLVAFIKNDLTLEEIVIVLQSIDYEKIIDVSLGKDIILKLAKKFHIDDNLDRLTNEQLDAKIAEYAELLGSYYNKAIKYVVKAAGYVNDICPKAMEKSLTDFYKGNGEFSAVADATITEEFMLKVVDKMMRVADNHLSDDYNGYIEKAKTYITTAIATVMQGRSFTVVADVTVDFLDVYQVTFVDGNNEVKGFLPVGADINYFANNSLVSAWMDNDGNIYKTMPKKDVTLYPVGDLDAWVEYNGDVVSDVEGEYTADGYTLNAVLEYARKDKSGVEILYQWYKGIDGNATLVGEGASYTVTNVADSGAYWCKITVVDAEAGAVTVNTDAVNVKINPVKILISAVNWTYGTDWVYDGNVNTVTAAPLVNKLESLIKVNKTGTWEATNAGEYTAIVSYELTDNSGNYLLVAEESYELDWSIAKAKIDISAYTVKWLVKHNGVEYTGFSNNEIVFDSASYTITLTPAVALDAKLEWVFNTVLSVNALGNVTFSFDGEAAFISVKDEYKGNYETVDANNAFKAHVNTFNGIGWTFKDADVHNHDFTNSAYAVVTKEATCTEGGKAKNKCSVEGCNEYGPEYDTPALGHNYVNGTCDRCGFTPAGETDPTKTLTDGVQLTGPGADKFTATNVTKDYEDFKIKGLGKGLKGNVILAYDINPNGGFVQGKTYTIVFDIPTDYIAHKNLVIYHILDDGSMEAISGAVVKNGKITFEANDFSVYALVAVEERSNWWVWLIIALGAFLIIGGVVVAIIVTKRKKASADAEDEGANEEVAPVAVETPAEEVVEEAPVEEVVEEAPVEEVVEEAPVEEAVEEVLAEEVVEEAPVEEVVEEAPAEEVAPEAPVEEVVEEAPAEEVVEEAPVEEVAEEAPVAAVVSTPETAAEEDSILVNGEVVYVHYRSSFTSRFIQAPETLQNYYTAIKNYILSYTGIKAKTSWNYEVFTKGRTQCVKLNIKGKSLTLHLALDPKEYSVTKYHFTDLSDNPKFAATPMLLKVKSDRGLKYALELIAEVMSGLGIAQGEVPAVDYSMPYESNASLAKRGIVKVILPTGVKYDPTVEIREANVSDLINGEEEKTVTREEVFLYDNDDVADVEIEEAVAEEANEEAPVAEAAAPAEEVVEEKAAAPVMPIIASDDTITVEGNVVLIRYRSSFTSRIIQADAEVQDYYTVLKNHILSYKGIKARTSWNYETFAKGRTQCARINVKGKTLTINLALLPESYNVNKYHFTDLSDNPKFDKLPMLLKVRSARALKYAMELIDELMKTLEIPFAKVQAVDYHKPYESNSELARRGLMKIILPAGVKLDETTILREENVDSLMDAQKQNDAAAEAVEAAPVEEVVETAPVEEVVETTPVEEVVEEAPVEEVVEEAPVEEVVEEAPVEEVVEEAPIEEVVEEAPVEEVVEEAPIEEVVEEAPVEEVVEEAPAEEIVEEPVYTDAQHADEMINDEVAEHSIEVIKKSRSGKMVEVNIDDICANFEDGDVVTLEALKAKRLVNKAAGRVKVLAKGVMTKRLTVEADKFSLQAVKMITLAGGTAKRYN